MTSGILSVVSQYWLNSLCLIDCFVWSGWLIDAGEDASSFDIRKGVYEGLYVGSIEILDVCPGESAGGGGRVGLKDEIECRFSDPFTNYDYYKYRTIRLTWATVPREALAASGPKAGVPYFGVVTFSTRAVLATLRNAQTPSTFSVYVEQQASSFARGITDRSFPFIDQPSKGSLLNLRAVTTSSYAILPKVAPDDRELNLHLQLYSRCNTSESEVNHLIKSSKACARLQSSFWTSFREDIGDQNSPTFHEELFVACDSPCFLEFRRRLKRMVTECSRAWKECPESCFTPPSKASMFTSHEVSTKQVVARRLLQKLIHAAEAFRRTSTYCEKNHLNTSCMSISARSDSASGKGKGRNVPVSANLKTCPIFVFSPVFPSLNISHSPWNPPFSRAEADVDPDSAQGEGAKGSTLSECPSTCALGVDDYVYQAGRCWGEFACLICLFPHERKRRTKPPPLHPHLHFDLPSPVQSPGCCAAVESNALQGFWEAVSHPLHKDFGVTWPNGRQEVFYSPSGVCNNPAMLPQVIQSSK